MLSLSKHAGKGLCTRPFDKLRVTGLRSIPIQTQRKKNEPHHNSKTRFNIL
jgi:hypothetical protein